LSVANGLSPIKSIARSPAGSGLRLDKDRLGNEINTLPDFPELTAFRAELDDAAFRSAGLVQIVNYRLQLYSRQTPAIGGIFSVD
jgi:hypothetical protein